VKTVIRQNFGEQEFNSPSHEIVVLNERALDPDDFQRSEDGMGGSLE